MGEASVEQIRYFMLSEDDDAEDDSGQQGQSGGAGRMCLVEIRCYPALGLTADGHARWVLERTVVPIPSSRDVRRVLDDAVDNDVATKISDRAVAFSDTWWIVSDPGGLGAGAEAVNRAQKGLHQLLVGNPAQAVCQALGCPMPAVVGGIAAELPLPIDRPLGFIRNLFQVAGMVFGAFAGMPMLATASFKAFLHDHLTRTIAEAAHELIDPTPRPPGTGGRPSRRQIGWRDPPKHFPGRGISRLGEEVKGGARANNPQPQKSDEVLAERAERRSAPARGWGQGTDQGGPAPFR